MWSLNTATGYVHNFLFKLLLCFNKIVHCNTCSYTFFSCKSHISMLCTFPQVAAREMVAEETSSSSHLSPGTEHPVHSKDHCVSVSMNPKTLDNSVSLFWRLIDELSFYRISWLRDQTGQNLKNLMWCQLPVLL